MSFSVIPAIDVSNGRLARLEGGRRIAVNEFGGDPVEAAAAFIEAGADYLHVVDMDLAFEFGFANEEIIRRICALPAAVQVSGGLKGRADVARALGCGADRAILGSAALVDRRETEAVIGAEADRVIVGIEAAEDEILPRGGGGMKLPLAQTVDWLAGTGATRFLYTDVSAVGSLAGPDVTRVGEFASAIAAPVLFAGGVSSVDQIEMLTSASPLVEGVIVGRALYEGKIDPRTAFTLRL